VQLAVKWRLAACDGRRHGNRPAPRERCPSVSEVGIDLPDQLRARGRAHEAPMRGPMSIGRRWGVCYAVVAVRRAESHAEEPFHTGGSTSRMGSRYSTRQPTDPAPVIAELRAAGITSKKGMAKALNARGIRTPRGDGEWRAMQVARVLARLTG
jgi:hypothetical protein